MLKTLTKLLAMGALFSLAACCGMYDTTVSAENAPKTSLKFAAHNNDFPSGSYYLDVAGAYLNGSAITTTCSTALPACSPPTPLSGLAGSDGTGAQSDDTDNLCPGMWSFTDSAGTGSLKLRDAILGAGNGTANLCDINIPQIADCIVEGTTTTDNQGSAPSYIDQVGPSVQTTSGEELRLRPGSNNVRVTCTLQNASATFNVGIE